MTIATDTLRAVGIVRVSQTSGRGGESFHSPSTQRKRIEDECAGRGIELLEVVEELDVSGGKPLAERVGLLHAVEMIEAGDANVIIAAYLDRLTRSVRVRDELVERVEAAGGTVLTVDLGIQTNGTASEWLTGTLSSAVGEYLRRTTAERSAAAQQRAIDRGVAPWPNIPPGYRRVILGHSRNGAQISGPLEPDPETAPAVADTFAMRANGAPVDELRKWLREHGIERSYHGVQALLASRVYLGEIHFGDYVPNLAAHPAIVDVETWQAVQRVRLPRGRRPKSERLLARLDILRCGTCGARMVVGTVRNGRYWMYRCPPVGDCPRRVTISAPIVEQFVVDHVRAALSGIRGSASAVEDALEVDAELQRAQAALDSAVRTFSGMEEEQSVRDRMAGLKAARDDARARLEHLSGLSVAMTIDGSRDWDQFGMPAQRALIQAIVAEVRVAPGRGEGRISIDMRT